MPLEDLALNAPRTSYTPAAPVAPTIEPSNARSANPLRPSTLDGVIGQARAKSLLRRVLDRAGERSRPLSHVLLMGPAGTGKTTLASVIANELGSDCYQVQAPVTHELLMELRAAMLDRDVLFVDEIHQQAIAERRGRSTATEPEVLYNVLEDRTIVAGGRVLDYPAVTVIGATTDEGMLPDAFLRRFPLKPVLEPYKGQELAQIAKMNADILGVGLTWDAALAFARACRGTPGIINNFVMNGVDLADHIDAAVAEEVVRDLNRTTDDGLNLDMQRTLVFLYKRGKRTNGVGVTSYQASVATIATAIGKSRDTKSVQLRVEPYLIEKGFLQVGHGGRSLTDAGVARAKELAKAGVR